MSKYLGKFEKMFNSTRIITKMCGCDVLDENYRMNWVTWSLISLMNMAKVLTYYSIYVGVYVNNDYTELLKCLCMYGSGLQGYAKLFNFIFQKNYIRYFYKEIVDLYTTYANMGPAYEKHLKESILLIKKLINILWAISTAASLSIIGVPVIYNLVYNERTFIMSFYLPVIDRYSDFGYYLLFVIHTICVFFGSFGNMVSDCWCFVFVAHIPLVKNILKCKFDKLNETIELTPNDMTKSKPQLLDIFKWHQKYMVFCNNINKLFFWVIFVQVATEFLCIVCTIVCIFLGVWPAAPAYLIYSAVLFYFFCALGNIVEMAHEDVINIIYNSSWYNMSVMEQKMILIMLRQAQQAEGLSIGGVAPLSLLTAQQLSKTFYTISMMLREFLE